eukprot:TRINITY_DN14280_c0_g1_i1.p1 TRINITY_DN14280_c0_g1~~TRINITY_DN14280_c0_g1_i1.p1  ORF type:complete len:447 (+),score=84.32 TRINITY_DN14280_c0_g1_i1:31-1341(+)
MAAQKTPSTTPSNAPQTVAAGKPANTEDEDLRIIARQSLLTEQEFISNYRGLINVAIILLVLSNVRLIAENMIKYGLLLNLDVFTITDVSHWPVARTVMLYPLFFAAAYFVEKMIAMGGPVKLLSFVHFVNIVLSLSVPSYIVWTEQPGPGQSVLALLAACIVFMKIVSYAVENADARNLAREKKATAAPVLYPHNVNIKDMLYFICVPVLRYSLNYPRTARIRRRRVLRHVVELVFVVLVILVLVEQYIMPLLKNALLPFAQMKLGQIMERVMKLAVVNFYVWFLGFFAFFHLYLNIVAELLRFGDRMFYKDWWNATTTDDYWKTWNIPTYHWLLTYVYFPLRRRGIHKLLSVLIVFFVSAFFHELVLSVPFHTIKLWGFMGMAAQVPLSVITRPMRGKQIGNFVFWLSIMLGQPMCVLLYYYDYSARMAAGALA